MGLILILFKSILDFWAIFSPSDILFYRVFFAGVATDFHINAFLLHGITSFRSLKNDGALEFGEC